MYEGVRCLIKKEHLYLLTELPEQEKPEEAEPAVSVTPEVEPEVPVEEPPVEENEPPVDENSGGENE